MIVNWKQTSGLVVLSLGVILMIFGVRESITWTIYAGAIASVAGIAVALLFNER